MAVGGHVETFIAVTVLNSYLLLKATPLQNTDTVSCIYALITT